MAKAKKFILDEFVKSFLTLFIPFFIIISIIYIIQLSNLSFKINLNFIEFMTLYLYMLPKILFSTIPLSFIGAVINAFAKLSTHNELIALFSLSYSPKSLIKYLFPVTALTSIALLLMTLFIIPVTSQKIENFKKRKIFEAKLKIVPQKLSQNFGKFHIFIENKKENKGFENVTLFSNEKDGYLQILLAKTGSLEQNKTSYLNLNNGYLYKYKDKNFQIIDFKNLKIYNNKRFYSNKPMSYKEFWKKNDKDFLYYILVSLSPLFTLLMLIAFGIYNSRYQKNLSSFYILVTVLIIYVPVALINRIGSFYSLIATLLLWLLVSFILFYKRTKKY